MKQVRQVKIDSEANGTMTVIHAHGKEVFPDVTREEWRDIKSKWSAAGTMTFESANRGVTLSMDIIESISWDKADGD
jgi:hypothetical protein